MKSFILLFILYVIIIFYGNNLSAPNKKAETPLFTFQNNTIYLSDQNNAHSIEIKCQELITGVDQQTNCKKIEAHIKNGATLKLKDKNTTITEDVFIRADNALFKRNEKNIHLVGFFDLTFGVDAYLTSQDAEWNINKQLITMPNAFYFQRGVDVFNGEDGIFDMANSKVLFNKNISGKINNVRWGEEEILEIASEGSLTFFEKEKRVELSAPSTISNQHYHLSAGKIKIHLNSNMQVETIYARDGIDLKIKNKNITAHAQQSQIQYNEGIYILETANDIEPSIDINGFRQTAHQIIYNEKTDTLTAGPTVKSVKLPEKK